MANKAISAVLLVLVMPLTACMQDVDSDLIDAAKNGQTERVKVLLEAVEEVDTQNEIELEGC